VCLNAGVVYIKLNNALWYLLHYKPPFFCRGPCLDRHNFSSHCCCTHQAVRKLADTKKLESQLNSEWTDSK
jgi:hypothetical protein